MEDVCEYTGHTDCLYSPFLHSPVLVVLAVSPPVSAVSSVLLNHVAGTLKDSKNNDIIFYNDIELT